MSVRDTGFSRASYPLFHKNALYFLLFMFCFQHQIRRAIHVNARRTLFQTIQINSGEDYLKQVDPTRSLMF